MKAGHPIQLFPASLLPQRRLWQRALPLLPKNTCLLAAITKNPKQTEIMRKLARSFRNDGWQVLIWMPMDKSKAQRPGRQEHTL